MLTACKRQLFGAIFLHFPFTQLWRISPLLSPPRSWKCAGACENKPDPFQHIPQNLCARDGLRTHPLITHSPVSFSDQTAVSSWALSEHCLNTVTLMWHYGHEVSQTRCFMDVWLVILGLLIPTWAYWLRNTQNSTEGLMVDINTADMSTWTGTALLWGKGVDQISFRG